MMGKIARKYYLIIAKKIRALSSNNMALIGILILSLVTRLYKIVDKDLWFDEVLDISQSQKPILEIIKEVKITPFHYLIVHFFTLISSDIVFLRLPSVLFGIGSVALLFYTVKKISNSRVALFSAFMLAISPMIIEFSQQILHYPYFIFFTILSLYFYFDLVFEKKLSLKTLIFFVIATSLNITTHLSAFLVLQLQFAYFIIYSLLNYKQSLIKIKSFVKNRINVIFLAFIVAVIIFFALEVNYIKVFTTYSKFDSTSPIPLGYSLVEQLKTGVLKEFNIPFFKALFSWFGNGGDYQLAIFFGFFSIGLILLLLHRFWIFLFVITWVFGPFMILNFSRLSHWFEEKYFIFVIPIYLFTISYGVITSTNYLFKSNTQKFARTFFSFFIALVFLSLAIQPINARTTYGLKVEGDQSFSWKKAIDSIKLRMKEGDIIMAIDDKFLKVYLGIENRNRTWISEEDIIHYTPQQYQQLVQSTRTNYYITIPDITDMRIGKVIAFNHLGVFGGFNTYKINFQKKSPINFTGQYIENFMKMDYLKDAADWSNVLLSYNAEVNVPYPQTVDASNSLFIVPKGKNNSFITYKFRLKPPYEKLLLRVNYVEKYHGEFSVELKGKNKSFILDKALQEKIYQNYSDKIYDLADFKDEEILTITFKFKYQSKKFDNQLAVGLKSFGLFTSEYNEPQFIQGPDGSYLYDAELEVGKNRKWWTETVNNFGWIQTIYGILYRYTGTKEDSLIYRFALPSNVTIANLLIESFTTDNTLTVFTSSDGVNFTQLAKYSNELREIEHRYDLPPRLINGQSNLYLKFQTDKEGYFAALRALKLTLK